MDFKVAGTREGITALQMDIKIAGINAQIMAEALEQAKKGRMHILGVMEQAIPEPREEISPVRPAHHHKSRSTPTRSATSSDRAAR